MGESAGQPTHILLLYGVAILVILWGLGILLRGEAGPDGARARMLHDEEDPKWSSAAEGLAMVGSSSSEKGLRAAIEYDVPETSEGVDTHSREAHDNEISGSAHNVPSSE
mmetsp:Transcript_6963/g.10126  ORF Transcript_6963/g.10126 Transcript_6963/m.10126 type:complete len:110 (+) Transcript_6963:3-332(+)